MKPVFFPLGRDKWDMEVAGDYFQRSCNILKVLHPSFIVPTNILTDVDMIKNYLGEQSMIDFALIQITTFVDATMAIDIAESLSCPILLWCIKEPSVNGTRLRLNSLTGCYSFGNALMNFDKKFDYIFGNPEDSTFQKKIIQYIKTIDVKSHLQKLTIGVIGSFPPGFYFSEELDLQLRSAIGVRLERIDINRVIKEANELNYSEYKETLLFLKRTIEGITEENNLEVEKSARFKTALKKYIKDYNIGAVASRCWPTVFDEYNAAVCASLSMLTEEGIVSACEADIGGALTMYIQHFLTNTAPFLADPVYYDKDNNYIIYWHCGVGACSLARKDTKIEAGKHTNRKVGLTFEFGLKSGRVTVCRLGKSRNGYRLFVMTGDALDEPKKFYGTSVVVKTDNDVSHIIEGSIKQGWEPHFSVVYGDIKEELKMLASLLNIEVVEY
ncbi:MAG: hypothetical protein APF76_09625 [Desulfitibacter sp. BRH_c19]|nr:MAG: hypothetical protein APF76_09625 [Desulfitibacter sp. BRH_c19]